MNGNYEVGYGKPPKQHQFQPGNKKGGRTKGKEDAPFDMSAIITKAMAKRLKIRRGDHIVGISLAELVYERLIQMAATGSAKDLAYILGLLDKHAAHLVVPPAQETRIVYHRAPGSTVELPALELWKDDEE